jgi:hypothetical protein
VHRTTRGNDFQSAPAYRSLRPDPVVSDPNIHPHDRTVPAHTAILCAPDVRN